MELAKNNSIDIAKGGLIVLVIWGHILLGSLQENFLRFFIYSFHMPMFLFISGYLLNVNKLALYSCREFCEHYVRRMLSAWFIAWMFYTAIVLVGHFSLDKLISYIVFPYYHLWYVPTLFLMISFIYVILKVRLSIQVSRILLSLIAIVFLLLGTEYNIPGIAKFSMFIYFLFGMYCREGKLNMVKMGGVNSGSSI